LPRLLARGISPHPDVRRQRFGAATRDDEQDCDESDHPATLHRGLLGAGGNMRTAIACAIAAVLCAPTIASAFSGFCVTPKHQQRAADATQVVMMRKGTRTVLAMQNNYKGPAEAFAMVIPVPTVLKEGDVKTLPIGVFQNVERMGAPRLVEYWEQD